MFCGSIISSVGPVILVASMLMAAPSAPVENFVAVMIPTPALMPDALIVTPDPTTILVAVDTPVTNVSPTI